ncbi:cupredoxin domain-containing protein [Candidatus Kaiserbacteria bacterium]|nr:cupredoxin domain-containing protein [Candidatus Kaiserbacteria bacterium]
MTHAFRSSVLLAFAFVAGLVLLPHIGFAAQVTVTMANGSFYPPNITVNAGDAVTWVNNDSRPHTATSNSGNFDSGTIPSGQSYGAIFNTPGTYPYRSTLDVAPNGPSMTGTITVLASGATYTNTTGNPTLEAQLRAQAQALLAQVTALQAQYGGNATAYPGTVTVDSSACPNIGRTLRRGISGDDVLRLQKFLARDPSVYPEAVASGYYGALTERAVQRWQVKYNIVSSGTPTTTGYGVVGPRTAAAIALLCSTGGYGGVVGPGGQGPVGGFITVSPISGAAPLTVNVTATVNTANSCGGAIYTLEFGDNTPPQQIPVSAGNCGQLNQTYPHTYQYGGTYQIKLSAGTHSTTATVTVTGPAAPPPPVFTPGLPSETFGASPTSGSAPLTVTFAGVVNSNDAGFCIGGCASALDFGDGTMASVKLPASIGGWLNYSVTHTYTQSGGYRATLYQGGAGSAQPKVGTVTITVTPPPPPPTPGDYTYSPPTPTSSGGDPLAFSIQFDLPAPCTGYQVSWGDGSPNSVQQDGGATCTQQAPLIKTLSHTYAVGGNYTVVVKRGATLARTDDLSFRIVN